MDAMESMGISRTRSSTVNTTMMRSRLNDAIWRDISDRRLAEKTRSAIPSLWARPTREKNAIVFSARTFSNPNEVKDTSLYVVERIDTVVGLMPKGDMGQSSDEREDLRHERDRMKHVRCRDVQPRGGPQGTDRGAGRVTSHPMRQRSWAVTVPFQSRQHTTVGCWFFFFFGKQ